MSSTASIQMQRDVLRNTDRGSGRIVHVLPGTSSMKHLAYARIRLTEAGSKAAWNSGKAETGLICLSGEAEIQVGGQTFALRTYDALYIPRESEIIVGTKSNADIAEFSAPVSKGRPLQFVSFAAVQKDGSLSFTTGTAGQTRQVNVLIGKNVDAGRLLLGFTVSEPGNYTSWPPHEHAKMLEEMYVFFDMPKPAFGIQMVYTKPEEPEVVTIVREGDAVLIPEGYHPNVSVPNHRICFLWAMAAHEEEKDRQYGVVNVQPEFFQGKSGLEASRK